MPTQRRTVVKRRPRRIHGGSFKSFMSGANKWLRKTKLLSKGSRLLHDAGVPYAGDLGKVAGMAGYGKKRIVRRRRRKGAGLSLGGGLRLSGGMYGKKKRYRLPVNRGISY